MVRIIAAVISAIVVLASIPSADAAYYMKYSVSRGHRTSPSVNNYLSARYDFLLQTNPRFRKYRMWKECHTITFPELRADCIASFDRFEPIIPS
jgi:hypothetical protein